MAVLYPSLENINRLKVKPTEGELHLVEYLEKNLDDTYEIFFNPFLDGDRPDLIILKEGCAAFVVEVKDWDLDNYRIDGKNDWYVFDGKGWNRKASPQAQAFRYKKNLYDLHLPVIGLGRLENPNFYNLIDCYVYFHKAETSDLTSLYEVAEDSVKDSIADLNKSRKEGEIPHKKYENAYDYHNRKRNNIARDKSISFGQDALARLVGKIRKKKSILFDANVYDDFKRRLRPSQHTLKQGIDIKLDPKQLRLAESKSGLAKIKGVAGCGKTTVLAQRALNSFNNHSSPVLLLTFNITLKNYIKDKLSDLKGNRDFGLIEISNYHQFFNAQLNNTEQEIPLLISEYGLERLYRTDVFSDFETVKYKTILIDEFQDYDPAWINILKDNFLLDGGEMVLFGDQSQNIYHRDSASSSTVRGFGRWETMNRSYRISPDTLLGELFNDFQKDFLLSKSDDIDQFELSKQQYDMQYSVIDYICLDNSFDYNMIYELISDYIKINSLHPNDLVILSSKIFDLRRLNENWLEIEKTNCMFESYLELSKIVKIPIIKLRDFSSSDIENYISQNSDEIERARRAKKNHFYSNSGLIKMSTTQSFKGLETETVFYLLHEEDDAEAVYTSITRSTDNLVVIDLSGKSEFSGFFRTHMKQGKFDRTVKSLAG